MFGVAGMVYLIMLEGYQRGIAAEYSEQSLTEWLESGTAFVSAVVFSAVAVLNKTLRPATAMLAALCCMMFIREADFLLDAYVFDGAWQWLVSGVLVAITVYLWRQRQPVLVSIEAYANQPAAGVFLGGFLVLMVFSRLFGRASFWEAVMGDGYMRVVKNVAEEGTEIMGYTLIAISSVELLIRVLMKDDKGTRDTGAK